MKTNCFHSCQPPPQRADWWEFPHSRCTFDGGEDSSILMSLCYVADTLGTYVVCVLETEEDIPQQYLIVLHVQHYIWNQVSSGR